ncbi:Putative cytochrome c, associated with quino(hemo)protein alcohol dehydrogenase [Polaromonas sp. CG9_12]|nr:Putative cytochrome c, associated with quino(hemo)protein alcohol dehydrogenase [Polaromonas sp. CG9_12]
MQQLTKHLKAGSLKSSRISALALAGLLAGLAWLPAAAQDIEAGRAKAQACAACHGADGNSSAGNYPNLAGQTWRYIYIQLKDFKEGRRNDPVMSPMAAPLSRDDMINIANYFAAQTATPSSYKTDDAKVKLGKAKADETLCAMCHLGGFSGQNEIPRVAGQQYDYVVKQLKDFKARSRTNDAGNMTSVAQTLSEADIENLAHYITSLR